jgi:hypothetical protein
MLPRQKQKNEEAEEPQRHQPQALLRPPVVQLFGEPGIVNLPNNVDLRHGASSFDPDLLAARWSKAFWIPIQNVGSLFQNALAQAVTCFRL